MATHHRLNPPGLFDPTPLAYHQVQISAGTRFIHVAGQAAIGQDMAPVGEGDFAAQMAASFGNLRVALTAAGATPQDVCSLRIYVVTGQLDQTPVLIEGLRNFFGSDATPPATLIGVAALALPALMIEIEATAII
jgi:enamine deaminase RidA (YjgF/YER057c/UK114 family)